jgi:hypothetical protein
MQGLPSRVLVMQWRLALVLAAGLLGVACLPDLRPRTVPPPSPPPAVTPGPPVPPVGTVPPSAQGTPSVPDAATPTPQVDQLIQLARRDLAGRLGVDPQAIRVVSADPRQWSSTALGCPEPGNVYAQVITPGYRIVLGHAGKEYVYHTDRRDRVVLCERPAS